MFLPLRMRRMLVYVISSTSLVYFISAVSQCCFSKKMSSTGFGSIKPPRREVFIFAAQRNSFHRKVKFQTLIRNHICKVLHAANTRGSPDDATFNVYPRNATRVAGRRFQVAYRGFEVAA